MLVIMATKPADVGCNTEGQNERAAIPAPCLPEQEAASPFSFCAPLHCPTPSAKKVTRQNKISEMGQLRKENNSRQISLF